QLALAHGAEQPVLAVKHATNLDHARVHDVRLAPRVVTLLGDDVARLEPAAFQVAEREVLVDLEPDRRQRRLGFHGQARVGPAAEPALEDAHAPEAALAQLLRHRRAGRLLGTRA